MANNEERVTFNETNVNKDMDQITKVLAGEIRNIFSTTNKEIDDRIANGSTEDDLSGPAATSIKNQWHAVAATFEQFMRNFQDWADVGIYVTKKMLETQQNISTVEGIDDGN